MAKKPTVPLKVTATLADGNTQSADGIIMFDGILYHAWFCKHYPEVFVTGKWMEHGSGFIGLPLRQLPGNRWAASRGIHKDGIVEFYCMGSADKILELLTHIRKIGKNSDTGWLNVKRWDAEEIEADYSLIHPVHGLMRPTPVDEIDAADLPAEYPIREYAVKPPYWKPENERLCYVPV